MKSKIEEMAIAYVQTVYPTDSKLCGEVRDPEIERHCTSFARALLEEIEKMVEDYGDYELIGRIKSLFEAKEERPILMTDLETGKLLAVTPPKEGKVGGVWREEDE